MVGRRFLRSRRRNFLMTWSWFEPLKAEQALPQGNTWVWLSSATPQSLATLTSCIVGIFYPEFLNFIPLWPRPHNWIVMQEDICTWALHKRETTNPLVSLSLNLLRGTLTFIFGILKPPLLPLKQAWEGQNDLFNPLDFIVNSFAKILRKEISKAKEKDMFRFGNVFIQ